VLAGSWRTRPGDRLDLPRLRFTLRRVRRHQAATVGVVGQRRWCGAAAYGVVGQGRWCGAAAYVVVGQRRWCGAAAYGVVGQWRWCRAAALGVVGQRRWCRAAALGEGAVGCSACCLASVPCAASSRFAHLTRRFSRQTLPTPQRSLCVSPTTVTRCGQRGTWRSPSPLCRASLARRAGRRRLQRPQHHPPLRPLPRQPGPQGRLYRRRLPGVALSFSVCRPAGRGRRRITLTPAKGEARAGTRRIVMPEH